MSLGIPDGSGGFDRDPTAPDTPTVAEVYEQIHGEAPSGELWDSYVSLTSVIVGGGIAIFIQDDAPQAAIDALIDGTQKAFEDPEVRARADEILTGAPLTREELESYSRTMREINPDHLQIAREFLRDEYGVETG